MNFQHRLNLDILLVVLYLTLSFTLYFTLYYWLYYISHYLSPYTFSLKSYGCFRNLENMWQLINTRHDAEKLDSFGDHKENTQKCFFEQPKGLTE
jgi:hypothetical protein